MQDSENSLAQEVREYEAKMVVERNMTMFAGEKGRRYIGRESRAGNAGLYEDEGKNMDVLRSILL